MIKYYAVIWRNTIEKVEVVKETANSVFIERGLRLRRYARTGTNFGYFDTFEQAKQWLISRQEAEIQAAMKDIDNANRRIEILESLEEK